MNKFCLLLISVFVCFSNACKISNSGSKKLLISQGIDHPALNNTRNGIIDALAEAGYVQGKNFEWRFESAQGNVALAQQIAGKFVGEKPDVVAAIGTMSAQSLAKYAELGKTKLIFSSVTDPLGAKLVGNLAKPGKNISGVSNYMEIAPRIKNMQQFLPKLEKLGTIWNPGDQNADILTQKLADYCSANGIVLEKRPATKATEILDAAASLGLVDAIFINNDNTALAAFSAVIKGAAKVPVFASDVDVVEQGALAALGPNQYEIGKQTGRMIARIFAGEPVGSQPVEFPVKAEIYLNLKAAQKSNVIISAEMKALASSIL